jgi:hypothetical protein
MYVSQSESVTRCLRAQSSAAYKTGGDASSLVRLSGDDVVDVKPSLAKLAASAESGRILWLLNARFEIPGNLAVDLCDEREARRS